MYNKYMKTIVLGGGCFWGTESIFRRVRGVKKVVSGYAGGDLRDPTYENHGTHAEVVQLTYDENVINLQSIFEIFMHVHNPTTVNQQGNDIGPQYRSIILCNDYLESEIAHSIIKGSRDLWPNPIITEVTLLEKFYPAEDYHQDYFNKNPQNAYCQVVINPKLAKFEATFTKYLK
jgi:peptide-methionine (S)-S-oxide reductase